MDPVAFQLGFLTIRWYGVFAAAGFLVGYVLLMKRSSRFGLGSERGGDMAFLAMIGGIVGARLLYVLQNIGEFTQDPWEIPRIDHGGLVFYGGFIGAAVAIGLFCRLKKVNVFQVADVFAPVLPLGHAFGRIGCLLNGCCFGKPWTGGCGVHYAAGSEVASVQAANGLILNAFSKPVPVFPVQVLAAVVNLLLCGLLLIVEKRLKRPGRLFAVYLIGYALVRFGTEFMRGDYLSTVYSLTPAQVICLVIFPVGIVLYQKAPLKHV